MKLFILLALFGLTAAGGVFQHKIFKTKSPETE
uniref:Uncharacterized protein n=1 Tax=Panagrolaimus sp. ES5 TaxID=591445 RepID=A0AC34G0Z7_9BILA